MQTFSRVLTWIMGFVLGALFGAAGTICYASSPWDLPIGIVVSFIGCAAIMLAMRLISNDRFAVIATGLGMLGALMLFSGIGPGGSVVVPQSELAMVWSLGLTAIVVLIVAWPDTAKFRTMAK